MLNPQTPSREQTPAQPLPTAPEPRTLLTPAIRVVSERQVHPGMRFGKLLMLLLILVTLDSVFLGGNPTQGSNWYLLIVWGAYVPLTIVGLLGAWASRNEIIRPYIGSRSERVIFLIPTIARKETLPGLRRVVDSILYCATDCLPNSEVHIVIDEGAEGAATIMQQYAGQNHVRCLYVPQSYRPANGTKYKARANEFALQYRRAVGLSGPNVFVYHGDDNTSIAHDTIWAICSFIARGKHDLAQGLLTYPHQYSSGWFCRLANSIQPADDMSRLYFYMARLGTPLIGCHGKHLLIRASIEDQIGWDFGERVTNADACFGLTFAARYPGRATFLASCCYVASPKNVGSLVRQRARRVRGQLGLLMNRQIQIKAKAMLCYDMAYGVVGIAQYVLFGLLLVALMREPGVNPVAPWVIAIWCANFAYQVWLYLEGLRMNLEASQALRGRFIAWSVIQIMLFPVFLLIEAWAAFLGLCAFITRRRDFDVMNKGH